MAQYLVAIQHPENYDPSLEGEAMIRDIGALNQGMEAAGARFFAGGLESASHAKSPRKQPDGNVSMARASICCLAAHLRSLVGLLAEGAEQSYV